MGKEFHQNVNTAKYGLIMLVIFLLIVSYRYYQSLVMLNVKLMELEQTSGEFESCQQSEKGLRDASIKCSKEAEETKAKIDDLTKKVDDADQQLNDKNGEIENLNRQLEEMKTQKEALEAEIKKKEEEKAAAPPPAAPPAEAPKAEAPKEAPAPAAAAAA